MVEDHELRVCNFEGNYYESQSYEEFSSVDLHKFAEDLGYDGFVTYTHPDKSTYYDVWFKDCNKGPENELTIEDLTKRRGYTTYVQMW